MKVELSDNLIKATRIALYQQWLRITDDNGKAVSCKQEVADATYEALQLFEKMEQQIENQKREKEEYVETNMGLIPLEDYYDIVAYEHGFNDYDAMKSNGMFIDKPKTVTREENNQDYDFLLE